MNTDRWNRVKEIFNEACETSPGDRRAFVKKVCRGDVDLEAEVLALLRADGESSTLLDLVPDDPVDGGYESVRSGDAGSGPGGLSYGRPGDFSSGQPGDSPEIRPGALASGSPSDLPAGGPPAEQAGPYRLVREIGRGGMGVVYLAERADGQFRKKLALKLVKRGMDTDEILHRFRHERQILASLEHPNIARLYDGGATDDGRPYLVMEYIEGEPITDYCDRQRLTVEERLQLFRTVCEGVQYAHQNLIVHRDLKPSNILVTADGSVRLLDFGVAKLLQDQSGEDAPHTRPWMRLVTPDYAAPEQFAGNRITTATDVYALGILLYELLTGSHPYKDSDGRNTFGIPDATKWVESPVARVKKTVDSGVFHARRTSPNALVRRLRNDLENIVMTALHPDPVHRYRSAEQLFRDISRHLSGHPVQARRQTSLYRFWKFVGRNKIAVASVSLLIVISVLFGIFSRIQQLETARERDIAETERDKALMLAGFMERLFDASNPYNPEPERIDTLRAFELLQRGARTAETELADRPELQANMFHSVGIAYRGMGRYEEAETYLSRALALRKDDPGVDVNELLESYANLGFLHYVQGRHANSEEILREGLEIARDYPGAGDIQLANVMHTLGVTLTDRNNWDEAEPLLRRALDMRVKEFGRVHQEVASTQGALASLLTSTGNQEEAHALMRESVRVRREIYGDHHPSVAIGLNNLAVELRAARRFDEAEEAIREALEINRASLGEQHLYVTQNLGLLGSILRFQGNLEAAEKKQAEAIRRYRQYHESDLPGLSIALIAYSGLQMALDRLDEAEAALLESMDIEKSSDQVSDYTVAIIKYRLGTVQYRQEDIEKAYETLAESATLMAGVLPPTHPRVVHTRNRQALFASELGYVAEADSIYTQVYTALMEEHEPNHPLVQRTLGKMVALYRNTGDEERLAYYEAMLE